MFLPVCKKDLEERNIKQLDFVYVCGDAYVDHPSFGMAIITRILEAHGYLVGIISQPDITKEDWMDTLGEPRLGYLVSSGNMDSMVNHYYVSKKRRETDLYSPGGKTGLRPDYCLSTYCKMIRHRHKNSPIIIGGIEASLRRLCHYDYWSNKLHQSILLESGADICLYGMGERSIVEVADSLNSGIRIKDISFVRGTVFKTNDSDILKNAIHLPSYAKLKQDKKAYMESFLIQKANNDPFVGQMLSEEYSGIHIVQNPPALPLNEIEMDDVYSLPYEYNYHPMYEKQGGIPAFDEIKFSIVSNRGCFGSCNFCSLAFHQGRIVQVRTHDSIVEEATKLTKAKDFKGYIHDVGGPTANFRHPACKKQLTKGACKERQCLFPTPCSNLNGDHSDYLELLRKLRKIKGVKKVFIRSGIRFDYLLCDSNREFFNELIKYHISGQLKVAPEHVSNKVLRKMGKPSHDVYLKFKNEYEKLNRTNNMNQFLVPYYMSSHPGSGLKEAIELAEFIKETGVMPKQVQDFYPTPSTLSTVMYYTELDPENYKKLHVAKNPHEKAMQRALIQFKLPENYELVYEALTLANRRDLIGFGPKCLIKPRKNVGIKNTKSIKTSNIMNKKKSKGKR